jgi:alpha-tubulin suppressor-like RCC1 family protein
LESSEKFVGVALQKLESKLMNIRNSFIIRSHKKAATLCAIIFALGSSTAFAEQAPNFSRCDNNTLQMADGSWVLWTNYWGGFANLGSPDIYSGISDGKYNPRRYKSLDSRFSINGSQSPKATRIYCGGYNTSAFAILSDNAIVAWGNNSYGQLGVGDTNSRSQPTGVVFLSGPVSDIKQGNYFTLALLGDGSVHSWGINTYGQLGDGSTTLRSTPTPVTGLSGGVIAIAAGGTHSLALMNDGTVKAWGYNGYGQLGFGNETSTSTPGQVVGLNNIIAIAAGEDFSLALKNDGTVWAWGYNYNAEAGRTSPVQVLSPVVISSLTGVVQIEATSNTAFALDNLGRVWGWGDNVASNSLLGPNRTGCSSDCLPEVITGLPNNVTKIYARGANGYAWTTDDRLFSWGTNSSGELGSGATNSSISSSASPVLVRLGGASTEVMFGLGQCPTPGSPRVLLLQMFQPTGSS